jgi:hypothetical protein
MRETESRQQWRRATSGLNKIGMEVKRFLAPVSLGLNAARHLAWYISYQVSGETREEGE